MKLLQRQMKRLMIIGTVSVVVVGCSILDTATNTKTYTVTSQQITDTKKLLNIDNCPVGQDAVALTLQNSSGGATVTVRCQ